MTGFQRLAVNAPMYREARTLARPPQTVRLPLIVPLSRLKGATPTSAAICRWPSVPSSGRKARSVRETCSPTPGTVRRSLSFSRHMGLRRMSCCRKFCVQVLQLPLQPLNVGLDAGAYGDGGGGVQAVLLRDQHNNQLVSASDQGAGATDVSESRRGRTGGRTASPKWASTAASRVSVLASFPVALAKSRTCLGLTTTTGIASTARARHKGQFQASGRLQHHDVRFQGL